MGFVFFLPEEGSHAGLAAASALCLGFVCEAMAMDFEPLLDNGDGACCNMVVVGWIHDVLVSLKVGMFVVV